MVTLIKQLRLMGFPHVEGIPGLYSSRIMHLVLHGVRVRNKCDAVNWASLRRAMVQVSTA